MKKFKMNILSLVVIMILVVLMAVPVMAAPSPVQATLKIITHVINDDGSPALAANFGIHVMSSGIEVASSPTVGEEAPGTIYTLPAGTYSINESNHSGYDVSYSGDSDSNGNITLTPGANKTVTITNNDNLLSTQNNKPLIDVTKSTKPTSLDIGGGTVTYTYTVTNVGRVSISNISVIDDEINSVVYDSGDINDDKLLQVNEVWVYTGKTVLRSSLTNTVIARGNANGMMAADTALGSVVVDQPEVVTPPAVIAPPTVITPPVVVAPPTVVTPPAVIAPPVVVTETVTGGDLPATSTPLFGVLLLGSALTLVGAAGWKKGSIMKKVKLSLSKRSIVTFLSLGFMILGIGCISWAMFNIQAQSDYSLNNLEPDKKFTSGYTSDNVEEEPIPVQAKSLYPVYPKAGDNIGSLTIPALDREIPIIQGTGKDELKKGVGHFTQSVLPGEEDNCVLSGHRDTVFRKIGDLKIGDQLIVKTSAGIFTYEVNGTRIVHADDKTVIVPTDHAVLTMTTCYPFHFIGSAPDRYILTADLVK